MATQQDLMGLGMPAELARRLGNSPTTLATTGTTSITAATINSKMTVLSTAGSQTGAIFPLNGAFGVVYFISNPTSTTGVIYAPAGGTIAGGTSGINLAQNKAMIAWNTAANTFNYVILA